MIGQLTPFEEICSSWMSNICDDYGFPWNSKDRCVVQCFLSKMWMSTSKVGGVCKVS